MTKPPSKRWPASLALVATLAMLAGCASSPQRAKACQVGPAGDRCACDQGQLARCHSLALRLDQAEHEDQAIVLLKKACLGGYQASCPLAINMLYYGRGVRRSWVAAANLARSACERDKKGKSCTQLGLLLLDGRGISRDPKRGAQILEGACQRGDATACRIIGSAYATGASLPKNRPRAIKFLGMACEGRSAKGCAILGLAHYYGHGVPKDKRKAARLLHKACELGSKQICRLLQGGGSRR